MAIGPILSELWPGITQQQGQKVVQAFVSAQGQQIPQGMSNAKFAELCLKRYIRAVVFGANRKSKDAEVDALNAADATAFPES